MENLLTTIGEKLKALRKKRSLTQQDVAQLLTISHSAYAKIERGETDMTLNRLEEVAKIFGMTGTEIMNLGDSISNSNNQNNNCSFIGDNSTITLPTNPDDIKQMSKKIEMLDLSIQKIVKRLEMLEKK